MPAIYRIITTLLDKPEIGPHIIDAIILDVFRTLYHMSPAHNTADPTPHNQVRKIFWMCLGYRVMIDIEGLSPRLGLEPAPQTHQRL